jgi:hypothetical protein
MAGGRLKVDVSNTLPTEGNFWVVSSVHYQGASQCKLPLLSEQVSVRPDAKMEKKGQKT